MESQDTIELSRFKLRVSLSQWLAFILVHSLRHEIGTLGKNTQASGGQCTFH